MYVFLVKVNKYNASYARVTITIFDCEQPFLHDPKFMKCKIPHPWLLSTKAPHDYCHLIWSLTNGIISLGLAEQTLDDWYEYFKALVVIHHTAANHLALFRLSGFCQRGEVRLCCILFIWSALLYTIMHILNVLWCLFAFKYILLTPMTTRVFSLFQYLCNYSGIYVVRCHRHLRRIYLSTTTKNNNNRNKPNINSIEYAVWQSDVKIEYIIINHGWLGTIYGLYSS